MRAIQSSKQPKQAALRQSGLQFKTTKKRTNRRPTRSKSSVSSELTEGKDNNYESINERLKTENRNGGDIEYFYDGKNFDFGKEKNKNKYEDEYVARVVRRESHHLSSKEFQLRMASSNNEAVKDQSSGERQIGKSHINQIGRCRPTLSNNDIRFPTKQQSYGDGFRYTLTEIDKQNYRIGNHFRNRTQSYDDIRLQHERIRGLWSNKRNQSINKITSINQQITPSFYSQKLSINDFQLSLCCSEDIFGKTYPARHIPTGFILCIKIVNKREVQHDLDRLIQCLKIQSHQNKQYIVDIYGMFRENDKFYVLMEYHNQGLLFLKMKSPIKMSSKDCLGYFHNICCAVRDLHQANTVYRNLKPQNLSLLHDTCKIANLSWSSQLDHQKTNYLGMIEYCSPELILGCKYNKESDIWALGVLLYEISVGAAPCHNLSRKQARDKIINIQFQAHTNINSQIDTILDKIFVKDPYLRPTIEQLIEQVENAQKIFQS